MTFSCVIGTHNPKYEWLSRAINSAVGLFDEIVLVDDGSDVPLTDAFSVGNVRVIRHGSNKGFFEARNTGIRNATGEIICSLDDDDYFNRDAVANLKKFVEENPDSDVYHFILQQFNESNDLYGANADPSVLTSYNSIPSQSWFRKSMWEELGGYRIPAAEDWDFWLNAYLHKKKFTYFGQAVYYYNRRHDSASMNIKKPLEELRREIMSLNGL